MADPDELQADPRYEAWNTGEQIQAKCDKCGRTVPILILQDPKTEKLHTVCKNCFAAVPIPPDS
jgi:hypothetical protein